MPTMFNYVPPSGWTAPEHPPEVYPVDEIIEQEFSPIDEPVKVNISNEEIDQMLKWLAGQQKPLFTKKKKGYSWVLNSNGVVYAETSAD